MDILNQSFYLVTIGAFPLILCVNIGGGGDCVCVSVNMGGGLCVCVCVCVWVGGLCVWIWVCSRFVSFRFNCGRLQSSSEINLEASVLIWRNSMNLRLKKMMLIASVNLICVLDEKLELEADFNFLWVPNNLCRRMHFHFGLSKKSRKYPSFTYRRFSVPSSV